MLNYLNSQTRITLESSCPCMVFTVCIENNMLQVNEAISVEAFDGQYLAVV